MTSSGLCSRPASTPSRTASSGTHSTSMCRSSPSASCAGPSEGRTSRARKIRADSSLIPGLVNASTSTSHRVGLVAGLLPQLAPGAHERVLPRHVQQPGGQLPQGAPHGVAVLPHEQHPAVRRPAPPRRPRRGGAPGRARRPRPRAARRSRSTPRTWRPRTAPGRAAPAPPRGRRPGRSRVRRLGRRAGSTPPGSTVRSSRVSSWRASAAATSPANSGCGRVGRERNSGCAWVPTKYGWTSRGSSTNSTSRPSGEVPEKTTPAASIRSR